MTKMLWMSLFFVGGMGAAVAADGPCAKDRETLCAGVDHGGGKIAKCLRDNKDKLSAECKAHWESMKEHMKDAREACHDDVSQFCGDVKPGRGAIMKCLKANKDKLSAACKAEWNEMKERRKKKKM
ncbi:MAG: hypothetical protein KF802_16220 [Bdellovibrionaceae bacterium]|nr:hypothetical protein [Pseudobdellovibrionaceae bacterium]